MNSSNELFAAVEPETHSLGSAGKGILSYVGAVPEGVKMMKKQSLLLMLASCLFLQAAMGSGEGNRSVIGSNQLKELSKDLSTEIISEDVGMHYRQPSAAQKRSTGFRVAIVGDNDDDVYAVQQTADGGYIVAGFTSSYGAGSRDVLLLKYNTAGILAWAKTAGGRNDEVAYAAQQTTDGGYIVAGYAADGSGHSDVLLLKFDASGALAWARTAGGSNDAKAYAVEQTTDGGYIVAGTIYRSAGGSDVLLLKFDDSGALEWARSAVGNIWDGANSVQQTIDGGYIVAGTTRNNEGDEVLLLKYDDSGALAWARTTGGDHADVGSAVRQTTDGGYVVTGWTYYSGSIQDDVLLLKYDASGALAWARRTGGIADDRGWSVQQTDDGGYIVAGDTGSYHLLLLKYDAAGNLTWARIARGSYDEGANFVQQTSDRGYIVAGVSENYWVTGADVLLMKVDADGFIQDCPEVASFNPENWTAGVTTTISSRAASVPSITIGIPSVIASSLVPTTTVLCESGMHCRLELSLNQISFRPNDIFYLSVMVTPYVNPLTDYFFVVLDVWGYYFYYPSWTEQLSYEPLNYPAQELPTTLLDFTWPQGAGSASGLLFYAAALDESASLVSNLAVVEFGFGE